jgi:aqualysin 1
MPAAAQELNVQEGAGWNLARITYRSFVNPIPTDYPYDATGRGVKVYVIDTGVLLSHPEFEGRAVKGYGNNNIENCNGHGTHVAGVVGSRTYGVAKEATIVSVRVFGCNKPSSVPEAVRGINWVVRDHDAGSPAVAVISLGTGGSGPLDAAVLSMYEDGITVVVAAGNQGSDACGFSPGHLPEVLTVGAIGKTDSRDEATNYGPCIDVFAPGQRIESTWNNAYSFLMSGTSSAAPHVAGAAALYLEVHPHASPDEVANAIRANATLGAVYNVGDGSPNLLLYTRLQ